jgi:hypothetical protein
MSTTAFEVIVAAVILVGAMGIGGAAVLRRRRLQRRFGPEYDRLVGERDSKRKAETELTGRERRVHGLDIQPLTDQSRAAYALQWTTIQEHFVDAPADAVASSQVLVVAVMSERGYPAQDHDQVLADLSVEHASTLDRYRAAESTSRSATAGTASTEELRLAMIDYRALFRDLLGQPAHVRPGPEAAELVRAIGTDGPAPERSDAQFVNAQPDLDIGDPVTGEPDQHDSQPTEGELTR